MSLALVVREGKKELEETILNFEKIMNDDDVSAVKSILGLDFYGLLDFFKKEFFAFEDNRCTILMTRRCLLLANWFLVYILKYETSDTNVNAASLKNDKEYIYIQKKNKNNYIISDKAHAEIIKQNCADGFVKGSVYVLDDICIHGRNLEKIAKNIASVLDEEAEDLKNIVFRHVYMYSKETTISHPDYAEVVASRAGWKGLSKKIVEFINYLNLPYVSYLNSFISYKSKFKEYERTIRELLSNIDLLCKEFGKDDARPILGKSSYFIMKRNELLYKIETLKCVRLYINYSSKSILLIPYVILDFGKLNRDESRIKELLKHYLSEKAALAVLKYLQPLIKDDDSFDDNARCFIYNLLSCIASHSYGLSFCDRYCKNISFNLWEQDVTDSLNMAFGQGISKLIKLRESYNMNACFPVSEMDLKPDTQNMEDINEDINDICKEIWLTVERSAKNREPLRKIKDRNITEVLLSGVSPHDNYIKYLKLCGLIDLCDSGRMNIVGNAQGSSNLKTGELGFLTIRIQKIKDEIEDLLKDQYYRLLLF